MRVTLTRNIGSEDLKRFGLTGERDTYTDGSTVNVSDKSAKLLMDEGLADVPGTINAPAKEAEIKAPGK